MRRHVGPIKEGNQGEIGFPAHQEATRPARKSDPEDRDDGQADGADAEEAGEGEEQGTVQLPAEGLLGRLDECGKTSDPLQQLSGGIQAGDAWDGPIHRSVRNLCSL